MHANELETTVAVCHSELVAYARCCFKYFMKKKPFRFGVVYIVSLLLVIIHRMDITNVDSKGERFPMLPKLTEMYKREAFLSLMHQKQTRIKTTKTL